MSAWRRHALRHLPLHRRLVDAAASPTDLWRALLPIALEAGDRSPPDLPALAALFRCAAKSASSADATVRLAVLQHFYPRALVQLRDHLSSLLAESEWNHLETAMTPLLTPEELARSREAFFHGLARIDDDRPITLLRRLKERVAKAAPLAVRSDVERTWQLVLDMIEAGEHALALEIFTENVSDLGIPLPPETEQTSSTPALPTSRALRSSK